MHIVAQPLGLASILPGTPRDNEHHYEQYKQSGAGQRSVIGDQSRHGNTAVRPRSYSATAVQHLCILIALAGRTVGFS
jgi:hypothetical protein